MGHCGVFVLPSRTEAMGRVLLEAMACAKPRIGSRVGGIPTLIEHDVDGLLFRSENVDELEQQLRRLMSDAALRRALGEQAQRRQQKELTADAHFARVHELYSAALASGPAR